MTNSGKKIAWLSVAVLLSLLTLDVLSAYVLFFYEKAFVTKNIWGPVNGSRVVSSDGITPTFSMINTVVERISTKIKAHGETDLEPERRPGSPYKILFTKNAELGWGTAPGNYEFFFARPQDKFEQWPRFHTWRLTIRPDGSRATSRHQGKCERKIDIFGDSWLFGWALDDELTMAWHLQSEYKDRFCVTLLAHGGYGHLQALRNFRMRKSDLHANDVLIFGYAQWLLPRNLPSPSVVRSLSEGLRQYTEGPDQPLTYPRVSVVGDRLIVDTIPLDCAMAREYCAKSEPTLDALFDITNRIFDEILDNTDAKVIILLLDGPEDKVIEHVKSRGVSIVDGRPPEGIFARDTLNPYDAHPGPISNLHWFSQLRTKIDQLLSQGPSTT
jgi:hypothetical protein